MDDRKNNVGCLNSIATYLNPVAPKHYLLSILYLKATSCGGGCCVCFVMKKDNAGYAE
jgi:hypothetical protein